MKAALIPTEYKMDEEKEDGDSKAYDEYELKEACETLLKAEMIKNDEKMMKALEPALKAKAEAAAALVKEAPMDRGKGLDGMRKMINKKMKS